MKKPSQVQLLTFSALGLKYDSRGSLEAALSSLLQVTFQETQRQEDKLH